MSVPAWKPFIFLCIVYIVLIQGNQERDGTKSTGASWWVIEIALHFTTPSPDTVGCKTIYLHKYFWDMK